MKLASLFYERIKSTIKVYSPETPDEGAQLPSVYRSPRVDVKLVKYLLVVGNLERREGVRGGDR